MMDHDTLGHSLILTSMEDLTWIEKGSRVAAYDPMLPGKTGSNKGSSIYHGPIW